MTRSEQKAVLEAVERTPAQFTYARRKGICCGVPVGKNGWIVFRREGGELTAEHWKSVGSPEFFEVFPELRERVEKVLDR